ncbi:hypothetical protein AB0H77_31370 [Streptomyces sp. NPDC050844]|uniref:hypothetical protein n=1 Tax=Streptomyces sp. NPDC050844 TaxID=3155790 RepID=UPI00340232DF
MHHRRAVPCPRPDQSPLAALEAAFLALAAAPQPLTLPAGLISDAPTTEALPVDQVRSLLAHPSTRPELRTRTWHEVVRRAHTLGEPWTVVAIAMAVPALRRQLARLPRAVRGLERQEMEQEALSALAIALGEVQLDDPELDWELFRAADRSVHRLVYAAQRRARREHSDLAVHVGRLHAAAPALESDAGDEYAVLQRAVKAQVVDLAEAQLIARTRLHGEAMQSLASERGISVRQLYRRRCAAEQRLAACLREQ